MTLENLKSKLSDPNWRIRNLYMILDEGGQSRQLVLRREQEKFLESRRNRNFVPKARKLGLSTIIVLSNLDHCIFNGGQNAGIIDITDDDAKDKLSIAKYAWDNGRFHPDSSIAKLWRYIHQGNPLVRESTKRLEWANDSVLSAGVRYTGKTPQRLHVSEFGPISAQNAKKAADITRGSINAVPPTGTIDIETTMEGGRTGECYRFFKEALDNIGRTDFQSIDWNMQFFSWVLHPSYVLPGCKPARNETKEYFDGIERTHGLKVPLDRQAWYERKKREQGEDIYYQFPTIVDEVDRAIIPGQIYPEMKSVRAEGRVTKFNPEKGFPRFTCWDLGSSDNAAGWEVQPAGKDHNFLAWASGEGEGARGVAEVIRAWESERGPLAGHLVPHDANLTDKGSGKTYVSQLVEAGIPREKIIIVPRIPDVWVGINEVRAVLNNAWFHSDTDIQIETESGATLPSGVGRMEGYRKKIDKSTGVIRSVPVHNECSHTADALRTYAEALSRSLVMANVEKPPSQRTIVKTGFRGLQG